MINILLENASSYKERGDVNSLMENEQSDITNKLITDLYHSAIEKADIDFDTIPDSKGDVTKYHGYANMVNSLDLIEDLAMKQGVKVPEIRTIRTALDNLVTQASMYEKAFRLDKNMIILLYNTTVHATVVATSELISSYVDLIKQPDKLEFEMLKGSNRQGSIIINNLNSYNKAVIDGTMGQTVNGLIKTDERQLVGLDDFFIPVAVVGGLMVIVPLIRELIFGFYYTRMKTSEYLEQQSAFLEINRAAIESSSRTIKDKKAIISKQDKVARRLMTISDKIKVSSKSTEKNAKQHMKKEESKWTLGKVQDDIATTRSENSGFSLL